MSVEHCKIIDLPRISDVRGNLTFIEGSRHVPFEIRRVYYLYDVPGGEARGSHAHRSLEQLFIAVSGSFSITADDGRTQRKFTLNRSYLGLYMPRMIWRELNDFSSGAVCLVLASEPYDETDYFRRYEDFLAAASEP